MGVIRVFTGLVRTFARIDFANARKTFANVKIICATTGTTSPFAQVIYALAKIVPATA